MVDLFCGSGALGLEALSRGAASATFVDQDAGALDAVRTNLASIGLGDEPITVVRAALPGWLAGAPSFDLALCDPPYTFEAWPELLSDPAGRHRRSRVVGARDPPRRLGGRKGTPVRRYARDRGSSHEQREASS